ncbi:MAG: DUF1592 domain-containing protein [Lentisphaeraceae bacterium]|nr:DUF1592 domain-containing protein [Lentisphaeraceae bacterium]
MYKYFLLFLFCLTTIHAEPSFQQKFLERYCYDCHDADMNKGDINLEAKNNDWSKPKTGFFWETVYNSLKDSYMPPAKKKKQPTAEERQKMLDILAADMLSKQTVGGTTLRRINKIEFQNSIRDIFNIDYRLPNGFPSDSESNGFDNIGSGLQLSSPLMQKYFTVSEELVTKIFPNTKIDKIPVETNKLKAFVSMWNSLARINWSNGTLYNTTTKHTGIYEFKFDFSYTWSPKARFDKLTEPVKIQIYALPENVQPSQNYDSMRLLEELSFDPDSTLQVTKQYKMHAGDRLSIRWDNSALQTQKKPPFMSKYQKFDMDMKIMKEIFKDKALYAAWKKVTPKIHPGPEQKKIFAMMTKEMASGKLNLKDPSLNKVRGLDGNVRRGYLREFLKKESYKFGPYVKVDIPYIKGPIKAVLSDDTIQALKVQKELMGNRGDLDDKAYAQKIFSKLLVKLFRKPPTQSQIDLYAKIALEHKAAGNSFKRGLATALRAALTSPHFLYRAVKPGKLDQFSLASRLSYFIWGSTPDKELLDLAALNQLSNPYELARQTRRLLKDSKSSYLVNRFTDQWLDIDKIDFITPDEKLIKNFTNNLREDFKQETRLFFKEIMVKNRPMEDFIDPDFTFMSQESKKKIYMEGPDLGVDVERISIKKGGRLGGILTQGSVLMATANGVDTQPIIRGVWMVEKIFGIHLPSAPSDVPALPEKPIEDGKVQTVRERVKEHTENPNCYSCHKNIDPLGFVFENFDPVGRFRAAYPNEAEKDKSKWLPVEPKSTMPDGTTLSSIPELKTYLVKNINDFSGCVSEKLMTFATGRKLNFLEKDKVKKTVKKVNKSGNGFQDLIVALVQSDVFGAK